jgi:signal peptidase II
MSDLLAVRVRNLSRIFYVVIAFLVFLGDQATKYLVETSIPEREVVSVIPGFFNLTHVKNVGAAFGLFADSPATWKTGLLIVASVALLITVVSIVWRNPKLSWEAGVGLSLILGGALSNLLDRIRVGRVVDFLDFYIKSYHWYTFNLADSAIVVGAGLLILQVISSESS